MKKMLTLINALLLSSLLVIGVTSSVNAQSETPESSSFSDQSISEENVTGNQPAAFGEEGQLKNDIYVSIDETITNKFPQADRVVSSEKTKINTLRGVGKSFDRKLDKAFTTISKLTGIDMTSTAQEDIGGIELFSLLGFILGILALRFNVAFY